jgi:basic membrane protein A and related proteins
MRPQNRVWVSLLLVCAVGVSLAGCKKRRRAEAPPEVTEEPAAEPASNEFAVTFVYSGPRDDDGFNAAQAAGEAAVAKMAGVRVNHMDNVPEDSSAVNAIEGASVLGGAKVVFATALPHFDPPVLTAAQKHPNVQYLHCGGLYQEGKHPTNAGSYYGHLDEAYYVAGIVAGMTSRTDRLGFIAGKAVPHVVRDINAFTLGARSVNPGATTTVVFTDRWSDAKAEEKAANDLADKKVDVLAMFVNSPRVILQTAERRKIYSVGVHVDGRQFAPKGYLTGAEFHWEKVYTDYVNAIRAGRPYPHVLRGGIGDGVVNISQFGPAVSDKAKAKALEARAQLAQGKLVIFKGPLRDNASKLLLPPNRGFIQNDVQLEMMAYLVQGVVGTLPD